MNKTLKVMTSAALLAGVVAPVAVTTVDAAGQGDVKAVSVPTIAKNQDTQALGTLKVVVNKGQQLRTNDNFVVELPSKISLDGIDNADNYLDVQGDDITTADTFEIDFVGTSTNKISVTYTGTGTGLLTDDVELFVVLDNADIGALKTGPVTATVVASSNSPFPNGEVDIAKTSKGELGLVAKGTQSSNNNFEFDLRINESVAGALDNDGRRTLKLKLPNGFTWNTSADIDDATVIVGGDNGTGEASFGVEPDGRTLTLEFEGFNGGDFVSSRSALIELADLSFSIDDETEAKKGDVKVTISGDYDTDVDSLIVGTYGDYQTGLEIAEMKEILSGKDDQEIGKIIVKEELANTWIPGRTILVTLPENARWDLDDDFDPDYTQGEARLTAPVLVGSDARTAKFTIEGGTSLQDPSEDPTILELTGIKVATKAGWAGDLEVEFSGSAGISGKVAIAKVINPFTVESSNSSDVIIGTSEQTSSGLVIKEVVKGAFEDDEFVRVALPQGVKINGKPEVKVTKGDLRVGAVSSVNQTYGASYVQFQVLSDSTEASEISIEGLQLSLDRTVPVGDVVAKLQGSAVVNYEDASLNGYADLEDWLAGWEDAVAAQAGVAKVITPAPNDTTLGEAVFTIGSTTYSVAGETKTMDVAPFVEAGRTFLPVRYVAEAVGVTPQNILYDNATATVTILKGDRVAQATLGSNILSVNGAKVPMDVKAKTVNDRTVLPVRFVAQALGSEVIWDAASQTATVK